MATNVGEIFATLGLDTKKFTAGLKTASGKLKAFGSQAQQAGTAISIGIGLPLAAIGGFAIKAASDFESSFTGIRKTVDATEPQFERLEQQFRDLAKEIPTSVNELNRIGEAAGQLGIKQDKLLEFTKVMADLGETTDLAATEAATAIARITNVVDKGDTDFRQFADTIVELGNNFETNEPRILAFAARLAGVAQQVGLTSTDVLGLSTALASTAVNAQAGGNALSRSFIKISESIAKGDDKLKLFAKTAGQSVEQFSASFREDAAKAMQSFIEGLGKMDAKSGEALLVLDALGLSEIRLRDGLLQSASAGAKFGEALDTARDSVGGASESAAEAALRYGTFAKQLEKAKGRVNDIAIELGQAFLPILLNVLDAMDPVINAVAKMAEGFGKLPTPIQAAALGIGAFFIALGPIVFVIGSLASALGSLIPFLPALAAGVAGAASAFASVLLPALAAVTVAIAAYKLTDFILEWTGLRKVVDSVALALFGGQAALDKAAEGLKPFKDATEEQIAAFDAFVEKQNEAGEATQAAAEGATGAAGAVAGLGGSAQVATGHINDMNTSLAILAREDLPDMTAATIAAANAADTFGLTADMLARASAIAGVEIKDTALAAEILRIAEEELGFETRNLTAEAEELLRVNGLLPSALDETGSAIEGVIDDTSKWAAALDQLGEAIKGIVQGGLSSLGLALGDFLTGLASAGDIAQVGLNIGADFAANIVGGLSNAIPIIGPFISGFLGNLAGSLVQGLGNLLGGLFGGKANIGETIGRELGEGVADGLSQGLTDKLANLADEVGSLDIAAQLGLGDIFRESLANGTADLDLFAEQIADTFSFLERGEISAAQATLILSENMAMLLPILDQLGPAGEAQIGRIISAAQAAGIEFDGMAELALQFGINIEASASEVENAFVAMGGNVDQLAAHMAKSATKVARAWQRVARILAKIGRGEKLGPTQTKFADKVGINVDEPSAHGFDGVVSKPTTFLAGEAGREHVKVTPLTGGAGHGDGGTSGPGGGAISVSMPVTVNAAPGMDVTSLIRAFEANAEGVAKRVARQLRTMGEIT